LGSRQVLALGPFEIAQEDVGDQLSGRVLGFPKGPKGVIDMSS
jgi:hypothetical protein